MSEINRLSPMTNYYLRKFIEDRQNLLHELLPNLQGEITLDQLFNNMCRSASNCDTQIHIIESLTKIHKQMIKNSSPESVEVQNIEKRLLANLGAAESMTQADHSDLAMSVVNDCLKKLNILRSQAFFYLGDSIGTKYLLETQPHDPWCQQFEISRKTGITYQGSPNERLKPQQISHIQTWIENFSNRCGNIINQLLESDADNEALFNDL